MRTGFTATLLLLAALLFAACGADEPGTESSADASVQAELAHVHGLGINPADGALFIATHSGLFRAAGGDDVAERVGASRQDTMGFTVVAEDTFLGSGHPGPGQDAPPLLGLIRSTDAGQSWEPVSLYGEADFHALEAAHGRVYGFDGANGRLMISVDGGESWKEHEPPGALLDLAVHPTDPDRLAAAAERGLYLSNDGGESWRPTGGEIGFLAWPADDQLLLVDARGTVQASSDSGSSWRQLGSIDGQPGAFIAKSPDVLYAALPDGTIKQSTDGGATWSVRAAPGSG